MLFFIFLMRFFVGFFFFKELIDFFHMNFIWVNWYFELHCKVGFVCIECNVELKLICGAGSITKQKQQSEDPNKYHHQAVQESTCRSVISGYYFH